MRKEAGTVNLLEMTQQMAELELELMLTAA